MTIRQTLIVPAMAVILLSAAGARAQEPQLSDFSRASEQEKVAILTTVATGERKTSPSQLYEMAARGLAETSPRVRGAALGMIMQRYLTARVVGQLSDTDKQAIPALKALVLPVVYDESVDVRVISVQTVAALDLLEALNRPSVLSDETKWMLSGLYYQDPAPDVRAKILIEFAKTNARTRDTGDVDPTVEPLIYSGLTEESVVVRRAATRLARQATSAAPVLAKLLTDPDQDVRAGAVLSLVVLPGAAEQHADEIRAAASREKDRTTQQAMHAAVKPLEQRAKAREDGLSVRP